MTGSTTPPVAERGEIAIELEGVSYTLAPSFHAIGEIETASGRSLYELAAAAERQTVSLALAGVVVSACMRAHARANGGGDLATVKAERIAELIYAETGGLLLAVKATIAPLLLLAVTGGYTAQGFRKPA